MRCNWFTTARTSFRTFSQPWSSKGASGTTLHHSFGQLQRFERSRRQHLSAFSNVAYAPARSVAVEPATLALATSDSPVSQAQLSRAACHAVRMAIQNPIGGVEDAYFIVNSLRYSSLEQSVSNQLSQAAKDFESIAIKFGRPVSSRLASHTLLHGLLRVGREGDAARLASRMMESGTRLRSMTLNAVIHGLTPPSSPARRSLNNHTRAFSFVPNRSIDNMLPMAQNQSTRLALQLLSLAGKTHQRRTNGMFATLIAICLINGEIILASLIFGFVLNEYQLRKTLATHFKAGGAPDVEISAARDVPEARSRYDHLVVENLFPSRRILRRMLYNIEENLAKDGDTEEFQLSHKSNLQALANLAVLLDRRQVPFAAIGPLLRTLYKCPRTDEEVWIVDRRGYPKRVKAYPYLHSVLQRLLKSLPENIPSPRIPSGGTRQFLLPQYRREVQPALDLHAYNTLLHYSLHHCRSPKSADHILHHMLHQRNPPLRPDVTTYNILLRSATLLRRNDVAQEALTALHVHFRKRQTPSAPKAFSHSKHAAVSSESPELSIALHAMHSTVSTKPFRFLIHLDAHSLSTYIAYLTSTGKPHLVADLVFDVFPELRPVPHVVQISLSPDELHSTRKRVRELCLRRAVWYGPHVLCAMLNALCKAGKIGLAKCVWRLALQAEQKSQGRAFAQPWCLPVHAYTMMIQCYVQEMKRPTLNPLYSKLSPMRAKEKARSHGMVIYRRMRRRAPELRKIQDSILMKDVISRNFQVPLPDARFFNAALELFADPTRPRYAMRNMAHYRHNFRQTQMRFAQSGDVARYWHPKLREISKDMARAGFAVPPSLRHVFVGRYFEGTFHRDPPQRLERRPLVYPTYTRRLTPFSLLTMKDRGLYHRGRWKYAARRRIVGTRERHQRSTCNVSLDPK